MMTASGCSVAPVPAMSRTSCCDWGNGSGVGTTRIADEPNVTIVPGRLSGDPPGVRVVPAIATAFGTNVAGIPAILVIIAGLVGNGKVFDAATKAVDIWDTTVPEIVTGGSPPARVVLPITIIPGRWVAAFPAMEVIVEGLPLPSVGSVPPGSAPLPELSPWELGWIVSGWALLGTSTGFPLVLVSSSGELP